ncbi:MAG: biotin transporter BioY [Oscillospiraceae bacterium]|nr:biotin transporter BioY [Oscillospiraceae bacterium]
MPQSPQSRTKTHKRILDMALIALFVAVMAVCAWISIPAPVDFTLQTFAVFSAVLILGGRRGTIAVLVYIILGAIGIPVFAHFTGGFGIILGSTGGYIVGFLCISLIMWLFEKLLGQKLWVRIVSMLLGLLLCYAFGTAWYMIVYSSASGPIGLMTALVWCVFPFIPIDLAKMALAIVISQILRPHVPV